MMEPLCNFLVHHSTIINCNVFLNVVALNFLCNKFIFLLWSRDATYEPIAIKKPPTRIFC